MYENNYLKALSTYAYLNLQLDLKGSRINEKSRNIIKKVMLILYVVVLPILFANREIYGIWNVFACPNRVSFDE
ncbi:hypothetical protein [Clostridium tagluense]|uniref:hypothetical protein n=1 Tax=Clostridium tagluense TaxID=360422 RepID=UPI001CF5D775|nr:hypothetical protein [Clostridium tagluense]MCB2299573.1 hypothetical protein [Clostridium tagluense]